MNSIIKSTIETLTLNDKARLSPELRQKARSEIAQLTKEFIKRGGSVCLVPVGICVHNLGETSWGIKNKERAEKKTN